MCFEAIRMYGKAPRIDRGRGDPVIHEDERVRPQPPHALPETLHERPHQSLLLRARTATSTGYDLSMGSSLAVSTSSTRQALEKCRRGKHVAVMLDQHFIPAEGFGEQALE